LFLQALLPEENMSHPSWSRRGVDGRDKPGQDAMGVGGRAIGVS
jgi:hypothetical protein